jgi:hypothetical protein
VRSGAKRKKKQSRVGHRRGRNGVSLPISKPASCTAAKLPCGFRLEWYASSQNYKSATPSTNSSILTRRSRNCLDGSGDAAWEETSFLTYLWRTNSKILIVVDGSSRIHSVEVALRLNG